MGRAFEYRKAPKLKRWGAMSKIFPKLGKIITMAAKAGSPDPDMNPRLRTAILNAKALENQIIYKTKEQKMLFNIAKSRIKTLKAKIKSAKSALKSALSTYKTIKSKYEARLVDNVAYLDALSVKTEAKSRYESSLNELEIAYAIFYYYAGKDPKEFIK